VAHLVHAAVAEELHRHLDERAGAAEKESERDAAALLVVPAGQSGAAHGRDHE
jgi:hypothetical protein